MRRVVIGGIPEPIGGVTSFISRLASKNMANHIIDIYANENKVTPVNYSGKLTYLSGVRDLAFYLWKNKSDLENDFIHFNFSRDKSLLLFLFLPRFTSNTALMLHHGCLSSGSFKRLVYKNILDRFDVIYVLSDLQYDFYIDMGVSPESLIRTTSYVTPYVLSESVSSSNLSYINDFFRDGNVLVCSGYPSEIYNHDWCVRFVEENEEYKLAIFLYGSGEQTDYLNSLDGKNRIKVFWNTPQEDFIFALSKASCYLRPTSKDSFGIAVADAVSLGTPTLCSNVCTRYPGASLFYELSYESFSFALISLLKDQVSTRQENDSFMPFKY
ncbi:glycosyltransferase [Vibrio diabolicus]|uniref:glycosyltransferase n=1 Tax=Vibrio diabolicus TaxID=50719 RepID=UPI003753A037